MEGGSLLHFAGIFLMYQHCTLCSWWTVVYVSKAGVWWLTVSPCFTYVDLWWNSWLSALGVRLCTHTLYPWGLVCECCHCFRASSDLVAFSSLGGDFWADQTVGIVAHTTWPRSVARSSGGGGADVRCRMAGLVQVYLWPVLKRNGCEDPLSTLEMTCESRGYHGARDLKLCV